MYAVHLGIPQGSGIWCHRFMFTLGKGDLEIHVTGLGDSAANCRRTEPPKNRLGCLSVWGVLLPVKPLIERPGEPSGLYLYACPQAQKNIRHCQTRIYTQVALLPRAISQVVASFAGLPPSVSCQLSMRTRPLLLGTESSEHCPHPQCRNLLAFLSFPVYNSF